MAPPGTAGIWVYLFNEKTVILGPVSAASIQEITTPQDNLCLGWRIRRNNWTPLKHLRWQEFSKLEARLGWNFFLTSLFPLYEEDMKDHGPQWANGLVHRGGVDIEMELNYWFATEEICNSKIEGNVIIFPSFREMSTSIKYTSANHDTKSWFAIKQIKRPCIYSEWLVTSS